jgi:hypothetical protein
VKSKERDAQAAVCRFGTRRVGLWPALPSIARLCIVNLKRRTGFGPLGRFV